MGHPIRVLVAKPGLDGHDRGALVIAQGLRDQGMEVIYTGLRQTPEQIVRMAIEEDVACIGLSSLSGAHMELFPEVARLLREQGADDILLIGGGVIPPDDARRLKEVGIAAVFGPGSTIQEVAEFIRRHAGARGAGECSATAGAMISCREPAEAGGPEAAGPPGGVGFTSGNGGEPLPSAPAGRLDAAATSPEGVESGPLPVPVRGLDHIGVAVERLQDAVRWYEQVFGLRCTGEEEVADQGVRIAFLPLSGSATIELMEPTSNDSPVTRFLRKHGPGLHHIAYAVDDIEAALAAARVAGVRLIDERPRPGGRGKRIAFLHPKDTGGVLTELCQRTAGGEAQES